MNSKMNAVLSCARTKSVATLVASSAMALAANDAHAWLGGFEAADGYEPFLNRVQEYNAGQYGSASGYAAVSPSPIPTNSGLWEALAGGFSSGGATSYATGHQGRDRTWTNSGGTLGAASDQGLVLTTGHEGWSGPALKYRYNLDANDLGGTPPITTGSDSVTVSFWWCAQLAGPEIGGALADGYFGDEIEFVDSSGNVGFRMGLTQRAAGDKVTFWNGSTMFETSIVAASNRYDRIDLTLDLATDTFSLDYFSFLSSTTTTLATGASMQSAMNDFTNMTFRTSPGVNNSKLLSVDDFVFDARRVPAPGSAVALLGFAALGRRRRS